MNLTARIVLTILLAIFLTIVLYLLKNRSNISSQLAVPILVALLTKYVIGDWDKGFQWSALDLPYWVSIFSVSYVTLFIISNGEFR